MKPTYDKRIRDILARCTVSDRGCWIWPGWGNGKGHGRTSYKGVRWYVHRLIYAVVHGGIPEGTVIDHICRERACCNPDHLEAVSPGENTLRSDSVGKHKLRQTHCPQGHPYSGDNLYEPPSGGRYCRTCMRERSRAWKKKRPRSARS